MFCVLKYDLMLCVLKLMCSKIDWLEALSLELRTTEREDFGAFTTELTYTTTSRLPWELFEHTTLLDLHNYIIKLQKIMYTLRPVQTLRHEQEQEKIYVLNELDNFSHVIFLRSRFSFAVYSLRTVPGCKKTGKGFYTSQSWFRIIYLYL